MSPDTAGGNSAPDEGSGTDSGRQSGGSSDYDMDDIFTQLDRLEATVTSEAEHYEVAQTRQMLERLPGSDHIQKYTTRDVGEAVVGSIVFAPPLLVEGGVFEIAEWFAATTVGGVPVLLLANLALTVVLTHGLLYAVDIRTVRIRGPLLGFIPRRLVGVLAAALGVAAGTMLMWGRLHEGDPTPVERAGRASVVWTAAALGAVLADILPGESGGRDLSDIVDDDR